MHDIPVPQLTTAHAGPLFPVEKKLLTCVASIEAWFRQQWQKTPPSLTCSVDLRHAGYKIAPVDTNLFPAGFNNLNPDFLPLCVQAAQAVLSGYLPACRDILIIPESHTRNQFYNQSLRVLRDILTNAGFTVRIGTLNPDITRPTIISLAEKGELLLEPLIRRENKLQLVDFKPCLLVLNNDLSAGLPPLLAGLNQPILPSEKLGWFKRLKSSHFGFYHEVVREFSGAIELDPWLINPYFESSGDIDFMAQKGLTLLASEVEQMLKKIQNKYAEYQITDKPFVVIKADNGTYGMGVMMVNDASQLSQLNRKQRTKMAASKGNQAVTRVIIQEGVYSYETMQDGAVAEPVVYMIGPYVVGGFYRVHQSRGSDENLNAPGMHFEPLAFANPCNLPYQHNPVDAISNRFYAYGVIARLAALAAAREHAALGDFR